MEPSESKAANPNPKAAARAAEQERDQKLRVKAEEEMARQFTAEIKTVNVVQLEGQPGVEGQQFEVWTVGDRRCLVVTHLDQVTATAVVCLAKPGTYRARYLVGGRMKEERTVETETVTLAIEIE